MSLEFQILNQSGPARRGELTLPHGKVQTPVFMPVGTAATVKAVPQDLVETTGANGRGAEIILANTYHLYLRPGHELIRRMGGVHRFMSWRRPMLTDSGGFQVFSLAQLRKIKPDGVEFRSHLDGSKHFFSPEHSIDIQIALGADILMAFDECTEHPATHERAKASMELTHKWARRSLDHFRAHAHQVPWFNDGTDPASAFSPTYPNRRGMASALEEASLIPPGQTQNLFGIVQGGMHKDLRTQSAETIVEMGFDGYAIGGLAVGEEREVTREMIAHTLQYLPKDKPRYVMGVGYPDEIAEYAKMGVDMMDCVLPTRAGRHGLLFTSEGRLNIKNKQYAEDQGPIDTQCTCPVCSRYTRAYLRHLFAASEALGPTLASLHNLAFYLDTMEKVREELSTS